MTFDGDLDVWLTPWTPWTTAISGPPSFDSHHSPVEILNITPVKQLLSEMPYNPVWSLSNIQYKTVQ